MDGPPMATQGSDDFGVNFSTTLLEPTSHDVMSLEMNNMSEFLDPRSFGGSSMDFDDFGQSSSIYDMNSSFDDGKMDEALGYESQQPSVFEQPRSVATFPVKTVDPSFMPVRAVLTHQSPPKPFSTPRRSNSSRGANKKEPLDPQRVEDEVARNVSQILSATKQQRLAAEAQQRCGIPPAPPPRMSFSCSGCNKSVTSARNLQRHRQTCPVARGIIPHQQGQVVTYTKSYEVKEEQQFSSDWSRSDSYSAPQSVASVVGAGVGSDDVAETIDTSTRSRLEDTCLPLTLDVDETVAHSSSASLSSSSTGTSSALFSCDACKKSVSSLRSLKRHHTTCKQFIAEFGPPAEADDTTKKKEPSRKRKRASSSKPKKPKKKAEPVMDKVTLHPLSSQPTTSADGNSDSIVQYVNVAPQIPLAPAPAPSSSTTFSYQPFAPGTVKVVTGYGSGMTVDQTFGRPPQQFIYPGAQYYPSQPYFNHNPYKTRPYQQIQVNTACEPSPSASSLPSITSSCWFAEKKKEEERCESPDSTGMPKMAGNNNTCEDCSRQLCSASNLKRHRATCKAAKERMTNGSTPSSNPATPMTPSFQISSQPMTPARTVAPAPAPPVVVQPLQPPPQPQPQSEASVTYTPKMQTTPTVWPPSVVDLPPKERSIIERSYAAAVASSKEGGSANGSISGQMTSRQRTVSQNFLATNDGASQRGFITVGEHLRAQHVQQQKLNQQNAISSGGNVGLLQQQQQHQMHLQHQQHHHQPPMHLDRPPTSMKSLPSAGIIEHHNSELVQITSAPLMDKSFFDSSAFSDLGSEEDLSYIDFETIDEDLIKAFDDEINNGTGMFMTMESDKASSSNHHHHQQQQQHQQHQQQVQQHQNQHQHQHLLMETSVKIDSRTDVRIETKPLDKVFSPRGDQKGMEEKVSQMDSIITTVPLPNDRGGSFGGHRSSVDSSVATLIANYSGGTSTGPSQPPTPRKETNSEFQCPECLKMYSCRKNVKRHRMAVHKLTPEEIARNPNPGQHVTVVSPIPGAGAAVAAAPPPPPPPQPPVPGTVTVRRNTIGGETTSTTTTTTPLQPLATSVSQPTYSSQQQAIIVHTPTFYHAKSTQPLPTPIVQQQPPPQQQQQPVTQQQYIEPLADLTWDSSSWRRSREYVDEEQCVETARIAAELKRSAEEEFELVEMVDKKPKPELAEADSTFTEDTEKGTLTTLVPLSTNLGSPPASLYMTTSSSSMASSLPSINSWNEFDEHRGTTHGQTTLYQTNSREPITPTTPLPTPQQMAVNAVESVVNTQKLMAPPTAKPVRKAAAEPPAKKIHTCHGCNRTLSSDYSLRRHRSTCAELKNLTDKNPPSTQGVKKHEQLVTITSKPLSDVSVVKSEELSAPLALTEMTGRKSEDVPDSTTSQRHDRSTSPGMGIPPSPTNPEDDEELGQRMLNGRKRALSGNVGAGANATRHVCPACGKLLSSEWNLDRHRRESCPLTDKSTLPPPMKQPETLKTMVGADDFVVNVRGFKFTLNKAQIVRSSGYFSQFFSMYDQPKSEVKIDLDPDSFRVFLLVMHGQTIVSQSNIDEVAEISSRLKFSSVWESCERYITDVLPDQSMMHAIRLAEKYKLLSLKQILFDRISLDEFRALAADYQYRLMDSELKAELLEKWGSFL